ncbi:MAG: thiol oxidoreductase [Polyangiaceae bacterium]|nr:thiol oxidoreductase [Polyangiaceae bacterium]
MMRSAALGFLIVACGGTPESQPAASSPLSGGDTTIFDQTTSAFTNPAPNLGEADLAHHLEGDVAFEATFVTPPATVNAGLGPVFNNRSCSACHIKDGRGLPVTGTGAQGSMALVRVSTAKSALGEGTPIPVPGLGLQLQDHAVFGVSPEATVRLEWIEETSAYPGDGAKYSLRRPKLVIELADGKPLPADVLTSLRVPPPVFGLGLLEAIPEAALLALEDPQDADGDGISGRANQVWDEEGQRTVTGRFGWKSNQPNLTQQAAAAYLHDMGVENPVFFEQEPELSSKTLEAAAFYTRTLAVPARRDVSDPVVRRGEQIFSQIGCASCHVPELKTGPSPHQAVAEQRIQPFTDLLLHNMGFDLADGRPDFVASGTEWRTPPLWGVGLAARVLVGAAFLHDGRARTLEEAVLWHGGEAEVSREKFRAAKAGDRAALLSFLESL